MSVLVITLLLLIFLPLTFFFFKNDGRIVLFSSLSTTILLVAVIVESTSVFLNGHSVTYTIHSYGLLGNIVFKLTPLGYFFIMFVAILSLIAMLFSHLYLQHYKTLKRVKYHLFLLQSLVACMLMLPLASNVLVFLLIWEGMSITSFFLLYFDFENIKVQEGAKIYFIFMHIGFFILVVAFSLLTFWCGSSDFTAYSNFFAHATLFKSSLLFLLFFIGFGTKAGIFPLYVWLPKAHSIAPGNVSSIMSGIMIKMGLYGILMFLVIIPSYSLALIAIVMMCAILTILIGAFLALNFSDMKAILASSSVENMGVVALSLSLYMLGAHTQNTLIMSLSFVIILYHCISHGILKLSLFSTLGYVTQKYHTHSIEDLGGIVHTGKINSLLFLISVISMSAMPILNLFVSEFLLFIVCTLLMLNFTLPTTILAVFLMVFLSFIGTIILTAMVKLYATLFLGNKRFNTEASLHSKILTIFLSILILSQLYLALFSYQVVSFLLKFFSFYPGAENSNILTEIGYPLKVVSSLSAIFIGLLVLLYIGFFFLKKRRCVETWACGSQNLTLNQRYTGESFTLAITNLIKLGTKNKSQSDISRSLFSKRNHLTLIKSDQIYGVYRYIYRFIKKISYFVLWMESKNSQQNILYLLIIVIILTVWIFKGAVL